MENLIKKPEKNGWKVTLKSCALVLSFMVFFTINAMSSAVIAEKPSTPVEDAESAALAEAQRDAENQTIINYVLMGIGIAVVIGVSWFTGIGKKKKGGSPVKEKPQVFNNQHSSYAKRYGANRHRGLRHS